jgi:NitT/TauT family transport system ATP-binding protein
LSLIAGCFKISRLMQATITGNAISVDNLTRSFVGGVTALDRISLSIREGEFVAILGPSGCGKSTLLRLIAGLDQPTTGTISMPPQSPKKLAYVFQDAHLLPWRNVFRNVALPLELAKISRADRKDKVLAAIERVGLLDAIKRYPNQLSGGMRMRVSLARAMVTNPQLLLLDEPFAALDEITRQRLDEQLRQLWTGGNMTVIFVTHSTAEAVFLANRAVVMSPRPGRIILDREIELPADRAAELRSTAGFAAQTHDLYAALANGGG